jgi:hypothetical protein
VTARHWLPLRLVQTEVMEFDHLQNASCVEIFRHTNFLLNAEIRFVATVEILKTATARLRVGLLPTEAMEAGIALLPTEEMECDRQNVEILPRQEATVLLRNEEMETYVTRNSRFPSSDEREIVPYSSSPIVPIDVPLPVPNDEREIVP